MPSTISLTEYKMFHPDTAEFPTLSQSGLLAVLLEKRRCKAVRLAERQAWRQAARTTLGRWWAKLHLTVSRPDGPAFVGVTRNG